MIRKGLNAFREKRVLLLQGPMGPFFRRLAKDLEWAGAKVCKVNFNGGDWIFYSAGAINYRGKEESWGDFFEKLLTERQIDVVLLFGDCRSIHRTAHTIAVKKGIDVGVFEEGYLRPDHITFERHGVNAYSRLPRNPIFYLNTSVKGPIPVKKVGKTYWYGVLWAILYYMFSSLLWPFFPHYKHHRPLTLCEVFPWLRSLWRKGYYKIKERRMESILAGSLSSKYFLVPLQVYNDSQICIHSTYASVSDFIKEIMVSFVTYAPKKTYLVIKHHPMDRGYNDYARLISSLASSLQIKDRVFYLHDQHLPTLLHHSRGVVVVNSTVGMSALHHNVPVKVCGQAIYDMQGLTCQLPLSKFWRTAADTRPSRKVYANFRNYLMESCQINGSFYKRLDVPGSCAGLIWPMSEGTAISDVNADDLSRKAE